MKARTLSFRATLTALFLFVAVVPAALVTFLAWRQVSNALLLVNAPGFERAVQASLDVAKSSLARVGDEASLDADRLAAMPALADGATSPAAARDALERWSRTATLDFASVYAPGRDGRLALAFGVIAPRLRDRGVAPPVLTEDEIYGALHGERIATHGRETVAAVRRLGPANAVPPRAVLVVGERLPDGYFTRVREVARGASIYATLGVYSAATRHKILVSAAFLLAAIALLVLLAAFLLGRTVARPVQRMTRTMERIAAGDEGARVAAGGAGELARLAESLNAMAAELVVQREVASRADRLAAAKAAAETAAHEIGNAVLPLPFALRRLERQLAAHGEADPELERSLRSIGQSVDSLKLLTGRLTAFASESVIERAPCSVNGVAELVADMYGATSGRLRASLSRDAGEIAADRAQLLRALTNLVKNALEAAGSDGHVEIRTRRESVPDADGGARVVFEVLDDGPGIQPDQLARVFQPYTSFKTPRGTGLGLAITAEIAARHGGSVRAENREEGGARFVLELPAGTVVTAGDGGAVLPPASSSPPPPQSAAAR